MNVGHLPNMKLRSKTANQGGLWVSVTREFSRNLQRLVKRRQLQDQEVAKLVGVTASRFSNWKKGHHLPRPEQWDTLAKVLKCKYSDFFASVDDKAPPKFDDLIGDLQDLTATFVSRNNGKLE